MMSIRIDINGENLDTVLISNEGHPETGEHPVADDLRSYTYNGSRKPGRLFRGNVQHNRDDGAEILAIKVLEDALNNKHFD